MFKAFFSVLVVANLIKQMDNEGREVDLFKTGLLRIPLQQLRSIFLYLYTVGLNSMKLAQKQRYFQHCVLLFHHLSHKCPKNNQEQYKNAI